MRDHLLDGVQGVLGARVVDLEPVDRLADQVDVGRRLLELVVEVLAEADDRVVQGRGLLLAGVDVDLQLGGDRSNFSRMAFWSSFMLSDSSKSQTTVSLCWLRWRRISRASWSSAAPTSLGFEGDVAGDHAAAAEVDAELAGRGEQAQARDVGDDLDAGQAVPLAEPLADPGDAGGGRGRPGADPAEGAVAAPAA